MVRRNSGVLDRFFRSRRTNQWTADFSLIAIFSGMERRRGSFASCLRCCVSGARPELQLGLSVPLPGAARRMMMAWTTGRSVALGGLHRESLVSRRAGGQRRWNHGSGNSQTAAPAFFSARTARGPRGDGRMDGTHRGVAAGPCAGPGGERVLRAA